jgi:hypothetical protein
MISKKSIVVLSPYLRNIIQTPTAFGNSFLITIPNGFTRRDGFYNPIHPGLAAGFCSGWG